jgi:enoyl-CoA hydratase/carnithine racemase
MGDLVEVRRDGAVARVVMQRGGNNAIAADLMGQLRGAFDELGADDGCRVIVLQSAYERYFSVGADLGSVGGVDRHAPDAEDQIVDMIRKMGAEFTSIQLCPKPVIARINGHALGGGCELTLCCDYRVMVEDGRSRIGQTEAALGIIPGAGGTQRLPRLVGPAKAKDIVFTGRMVAAAEALEIGLVDRVVPDAEVYQAALDLVQRYATGPALALRAAKQAIDYGLGVDLATGLEIERVQFAALFGTADQRTGMHSFLENGPGKATFTCH